MLFEWDRILAAQNTAELPGFFAQDGLVTAVSACDRGLHSGNSTTGNQHFLRSCGARGELALERVFHLAVERADDPAVLDQIGKTCKAADAREISIAATAPWWLIIDESLFMTGMMSGVSSAKL